MPTKKLKQSLLPIKYVPNPSKCFSKKRKLLAKQTKVPIIKKQNRSLMWRTKKGATKLSAHLRQVNDEHGYLSNYSWLSNLQELNCLTRIPIYIFQ
jgi:hypothetical protein